MMPLYTSNDYYKRMLDLQERLRNSDKDRIRLEERFSVLEKEARRRHETCIEHLRMKYADFLEQQQAREERNYQLLEALDRIDSSLAVMTAKTHRLNILRRQYKASKLPRYETGHSSNSGARSSSVARPNNEGQLESVKLSRGNSSRPSLLDRNTILGSRGRTDRTNGSSTSAGQGCSYGSSWSSNNLVNSPTGPRRFKFLPFPPIGKDPGNENSELSASFIDVSSENLRPKSSSELHELAFEPYDGNLVTERPVIYESRNNYASYFKSHETPFLQNIGTPISNVPLKYGTPLVRKLMSARALESHHGDSDVFVKSTDHFQHPNYCEQSSVAHSLPEQNLDNVPCRNSILPLSQSSIAKNGKISESLNQRSPQVLNFLKQEPRDNECVQNLGGNNLQRYMNQIQYLHRNAGAQSLEDMNHERNSSGDSPNVTLSGDGLDLLVEKKLRDELLPQKFGSVPPQARDVANEGALRRIDGANNVYEHIPIGERINSNDVEYNEVKCFEDCIEGLRKSESYEPNSAGTDEDHRPPSISPQLEKDESYNDGHGSSSEKLHRLANNEIVGSKKPHLESPSKVAGNIDVYAHSPSNDRDQKESNLSLMGTHSHADQRDALRSSNENIDEEKPDKCPLAIRQSEESEDGDLNSEERKPDETLHNVGEVSELRNPEALETRIHETIVNDDQPNDSNSRGFSSDTDNRSTESERVGNGISEITDRPNDPQAQTPEKDLTTLENNSSENRENRNHEEISANIFQAEGPAIELSPYATEVSSDGGNIIDRSNFTGDAFPPQGLEHGGKTDGAIQNNNLHVLGEHLENNNGHHTQNYDQQYREDSNQQYSLNAAEQIMDNAQYVENLNPQEYMESHNLRGNSESSNEHRECWQEPNLENVHQELNHQEYVESLNENYGVEFQDQYPTGASQQYSQDSNQEYGADRYEPDPTQQYDSDSGQQNVIDTNRLNLADPDLHHSVDMNQQYLPDLNHQRLADTGHEYLVDADQRHLSDPNQLYTAEPNQLHPAEQTQEYSPNPDPHQQYWHDDGYLQSQNQEYLSEKVDHLDSETKGDFNSEGYTPAYDESTVTYELENVQRD